MTAGRRAPAFFAAAAAALGALFGLHRIVDPDLFLQVATGRAILARPASLGISSFVAAYPGYNYVEDKWLFSVIAALADRAGGETALMLIQIGLAAAVALAWWGLARVQGAEGPAAVALVAAGLAATAFRLEPRPETASHALLAAAIALPLLRLAPRARLAATIALAVLWVNLHGYFINGLLVLAAVLLASLLGDREMPEPRQAAGFLAAGIAASALHPQGIRALLWPVEQLRVLRSEPIVRQAILEFFPTADLFAGMGVWRWALLVAAPIAALALAWPRVAARGLRRAAALACCLPWLAAPPPGFVPWPYRVSLCLLIAAVFEVPAELRARRYYLPVLLAGFTILAVPLVRNISLVIPVCLALLGRGLAQDTPLRSGARLRLVPAAAVAFTLLVAWGRISDHLAPGTARAPGWTGWGVDERRFPAGAARFAGAHALNGPMLNSFDAGGYLLYALGADRPVLIDGNTSHYPASWLETYRNDVMGGTSQEGARLALLDHAAMDAHELAARLSRDAEWRLVFADAGGAVWMRQQAGTAANLPAPDLAPLAATSPDDRSPLPVWLGPRPRVFPALNTAIFLRAAGCPDPAISLCESLWSAAPAPEIATVTAAAAEEAGRLPQQVGFLETAMERFPESATVRSALARALFMRGVSGPADARADLTRSRELAPDEPGPLLALARLDAEAGNTAAARQSLKSALALDHDGGIRRFAAQDPVLSPILRQIQ